MIPEFRNPQKNISSAPWKIIKNEKPCLLQHKMLKIIKPLTQNNRIPKLHLECELQKLQHVIPNNSCNNMLVCRLATTKSIVLHTIHVNVTDLVASVTVVETSASYHATRRQFQVTSN